jgi:hypothetical protein
MFLILSKYAGGPLVSDDFYYLDTGLNGIKDLPVLFYYTHIYFQRIFMEFAASPLAGAKYYWSFLITSTSLLIYLSSRLFIKRSSWVNGFLGVALFLSLDFLAKYSGVTKNDFTAMFIVVFIILIFLLASKSGFKNPWLISLLGFLFFLAFKSKETAVIIGVIFLGFGFVESENFKLKVFWNRLRFFLIGFLVGGLFIMLLNTLIVGDTFWGIRPSDFLDYLNITGRNINKVPVDMNFLTNIIINLLTVPFLLYLISAFQVDGLQFGNHLKLIWIYPFLLTIFLTVVLFASGHGVTDRFLFPAVPVSLAPRYFNFATSKPVVTKLDWEFIPSLVS